MEGCILFTARLCYYQWIYQDLHLKIGIIKCRDSYMCTAYCICYRLLCVILSRTPTAFALYFTYVWEKSTVSRSAIKSFCFINKPKLSSNYPYTCPIPNLLLFGSTHSYFSKYLILTEHAWISLLQSVPSRLTITHRVGSL